MGYLKKWMFKLRSIFMFSLLIMLLTFVALLLLQIPGRMFTQWLDQALKAVAPSSTRLFLMADIVPLISVIIFAATIFIGTLKIFNKNVTSVLDLIEFTILLAVSTIIFWLALGFASQLTHIQQNDIYFAEKFGWMFVSNAIILIFYILIAAIYFISRALTIRLKSIRIK